jgi:glycogen phosphorylase
VTWWEQMHGDESMLVAYFSMEFGIDERLPIYSGGLGILAGDHLKSAADLGIPLVAVGLFYRHGYFRQRLEDGRQTEWYAEADPEQMGLVLEPVEVEAEVGDERLTARNESGRKRCSASAACERSQRLDCGRPSTT